MYDFDTVHLRNNHASEKWDAAIRAGCPPEVVPLTVADMEFRTAPEIIDAVKETADFGMWGYTYANNEFKQAAAAWMNRRHNWPARADWVVSATGVVPGLYTAIRAFTKPGDSILVQTLVYPPLFNGPIKNGRKIVENPLVEKDGHYEMDLEDLRRKAAGVSMMILCSPHNPVGRVWGAEELRAVAEICAEHDVLLFSDEIHCDIIMPPHQFVSMGSLPEKYIENMIIATSASKTFSLAGLGCCSLFIPNEGLRNRFLEQQGIDGCSMFSTFGVVGTVAAYQKGEAWLDEMVNYVAENHRFLQQYTAENMPQLRVYPLEGTYLAWMDLRAVESHPKKLQVFLEQQAQLYVNNGATFGTAGEGFVRINLACPRQVLRQAMQRLCAALK